MGLSVAIVAMNEEAIIGRTLDSVRWADEIVLVDSGSTDRTCEIAREYARWLAQQRRAGLDVGDTAREQQMHVLEAAHPTFPFVWLLAGCVLASLAGGALRTQPREREFVSRRLVATAAVVG